MIEDQIFDEIKKANSILLHLHPSPDCDSQGSALAMYHALMGLGKKVTVIKGDSDLDPNMAHLPGADKIVAKNFLEIDQKDFDLFIVQDSSLDRITTKGSFEFDPHLTIVNIDHHASNKGDPKSINLIDTSASSTTLILFRLFKKWGIPLTNTIARNLILGLYTDTGNFVHSNTTKEALLAAVELRDLAPEFHDDLAKVHMMKFELLQFESLAYKKVEKFGNYALAVISFEDMQKENIDPKIASASMIAGILVKVEGFEMVGCLVEDKPNFVKCSFRSQDADKFDVSIIANDLGGGGHRMAAGVLLKYPITEAKQRVLSAINKYTT